FVSRRPNPRFPKKEEVRNDGEPELRRSDGYRSRISPSPCGAPRPRAPARGPGGQAAAVRRRRARREAPEERKAPHQGPHGDDRAHAPHRGRALKIPIAREGWIFFLPPLLIAAGAGATGHGIFAAVFGALGIFLVSFFRDPEREP